jgi:hypothetical protein
VSPATWDFTIYGGADFERTLTWSDDEGDPVDLTGYSAEMAAVGLFDVSDGDGLVLDDAGHIILTVPPLDLSVRQRQPYQLILTAPSGTATMLVRGHILYEPAVGA